MHEETNAARPGGSEVRAGMSVAAIKRDYLDNLFSLQALWPEWASDNDRYMALAYTVRERLLRRWLISSKTAVEKRWRRVCYLSAEYLPGPHLENNLLCLGMRDATRQAMQELGLDFERLLRQEEEPGLGNGGLGRLAACYLDSLATHQIPATGYGMRYEFGMFDQTIRDGWQAETSDKWLRIGNPWEVVRPETVYEVKLGGRAEGYRDGSGRFHARWIPRRVVKGVACDTPILGYGSPLVNTMRLWKTEAHESFDIEAFNAGAYYRAVEEKFVSESISKVLYPNDEPLQGKYLRLAQQYVIVSCSLQDMLRALLWAERDPGLFADRYAIQLNDTHPAVAVPELMRLLIDEHDMDWEPAWAITRRAFAYTNHTLLPEALEKWSVRLFGTTLPRHLEIVCEINRRFLEEVRGRFPGDDDKVARLSIIDETGERFVRMAHLACVGSHAINGVSRLHTELLCRETLRDFHDLWPERFSNKTNGVTPRRFLLLSNPGLASLISERIGEGWIRNLEELRRLEPLADDTGFREAWRRVKRGAKEALAREIRARTGVTVDPDSLFDIHAKRIHEYKRQQLNALRVIALYERIRRDPNGEHAPRTVIFAGKASPGYSMAKLIIKLINSIAEVVNSDPATRDRLKVVFFPNFNVRNAQHLYPAADVSEQISTAGKEASGTGNMKFALNGALTIGTLDGANIEIREEVGPENFFAFGMTAEEVARHRREGYRPQQCYEENEELRQAIDQIAGGCFSRGDRELFMPLVSNLLAHDDYMVLADFRDYDDRQREIARAYRDRDRWTRMSILNVARMGRFSSDRAVREYCREIWHIDPLPVPIEDI
jgi:starch phosphorylase